MEKLFMKNKRKLMENKLMLPLFKNMYFLAKENIPIAKYPKLKDLLSNLGVE